MHFTKGLTCATPLLNLLARQEISAPDEDLPELFPVEESGTNTLEDEGFSDFPEPGGNSTGPRIEQWDAGRIPEGCAQAIDEPGIVGGRCPFDELEVYDVYYEDCEQQPWTICRCSTNEGDMDRLVEDLGQLPVGARDYVRYVIMSDDYMIDGQSAYEGMALYEIGDLIIFGNWSSVGLFVHESTHVLDYHVAGRGRASYSESDEWRDIVDGDTCVADWYSKSAYGEAYAQGAVLVAFDLNESGPLSDVVNYTCASGVHEKITEQLGDLLTYDEDATCQHRFPKTRELCVQDDGDIIVCPDQPDDEDSIDNTDDNDNTSDGGDDDDNNNDDDESPATRPNVLGVFRLIAQVLRFTGLLHGQ